MSEKECSQLAKVLNQFLKTNMKLLLIAAFLAGGLAACNNAGNRDSDMRDSAAIEDRRMDTSLNRPGDSAMRDTLNMDTTNRPKGTADSIRQRY